MTTLPEVRVGDPIRHEALTVLLSRRMKEVDPRDRACALRPRGRAFRGQRHPPPRGVGKAFEVAVARKGPRVVVG